MTKVRPADPSTAVDDLTDGLTIAFQSLQRLKAAVARSASPESQRERAAHVLLFPLRSRGPLRQTELAEVVHADPSTVSRHVARLVEHGLVQRVPDERDGRASTLVVTERGEATAEAMRRERSEHLRIVTEGWEEQEVAHLARLLHRLAADVDARAPAVVAPR